jgi:hypothetical protein
MPRLSGKLGIAQPETIVI